LRTLLAALLVLLAAPSWAGLPVSYDAELRAFENRVHGGDPLGFSLFGTADCSGTPVYSQILGAGTPPVIRGGRPAIATPRRRNRPW